MPLESTCKSMGVALIEFNFLTSRFIACTLLVLDTNVLVLIKVVQKFGMSTWKERFCQFNMSQTTSIESNHWQKAIASILVLAIASMSVHSLVWPVISNKYWLKRLYQGTGCCEWNVACAEVLQTRTETLGRVWIHFEITQFHLESLRIIFCSRFVFFWAPSNDSCVS